MKAALIEAKLGKYQTSRLADSNRLIKHYIKHFIELGYSVSVKQPEGA